LIAESITRVAGSSDYFLGSFVTYSNEMKAKLLGVDETLLKEHGAVSPQVAQAMAAGAIQKSGADVAVAVTGIAGPGGGTAEKPVGLVYIGVADKQKAKAKRYKFFGDRDAIRERTRVAALNEMRLRLGED
jgi:PncC family amidohydrolase